MAAAQPAYSDDVQVPCSEPKPRLRLVVSNPGKGSRRNKKRSSYGGRPVVISRARYYDPKVGRFVTKDPIGFKGKDYNLYGYTHNNPINYTDPSGLADITTTDFTVDLTVVGAGESVVKCCDKNKRMHKATYHKFCFGFALGATAVSFGAPQTSSQCPPQNGWGNEIGGALGAGWNASWSGGEYSVGPAIGVGGGYMRCYYRLWSDIIEGCCNK